MTQKQKLHSGRYKERINNGSVFDFKLSPCFECILHILHPALEDGTDRGFRNVGKPQSDAAEIPKRIHTKW